MVSISHSACSIIMVSCWRTTNPIPLSYSTPHGSYFCGFIPYVLPYVLPWFLGGVEYERGKVLFCLMYCQQCSHVLSWVARIILVGGLEHFLVFHSVGNNHPNWLIFFRGVETTNVDPFFVLFPNCRDGLLSLYYFSTSIYLICSILKHDPNQAMALMN
jgi:hypothetical protein